MGEIGRQTRKGARRDAFAQESTVGKRLDAVCRLISPTPHGRQLGVAPDGPPASSKASTVAQGYAFRPSPNGARGGSDAARRDDGPILARYPG